MVFFCFFVVSLRSFLFCHCVTLRDLKDTLQFFFFFFAPRARAETTYGVTRFVDPINLERYTEPTFFILIGELPLISSLFSLDAEPGRFAAL